MVSLLKNFKEQWVLDHRGRWRCPMRAISKIVLLALLMFFMNVGLSFGHSLLISQSTTDDKPDDAGIGGSNYRSMTFELTSRFDEVTYVPDFENVELQEYDALWLDLRSNSQPGISDWSGYLTDIERNRIMDFIASGRRVVMIGEWGWGVGSQPALIKYTAWDNQILGIVGGTYAGAYSGYFVNPRSVIENELTQGVNSLDVNSRFPGNYGTAAAGTPFFDPAIANLWGTKENVVTILDNGFYDDEHWVRADNSRFAQNVAVWLATPVVELDTTPPTITNASAFPSVIWPPNRKMVDVTVNYSVTDTEDDNPSCVISEVASNEPSRRSDFSIVDAHHVKLSAECLGKDGRLYIISISCTDASGNTSIQAVIVTVPHDQRTKN